MSGVSGVQGPTRPQLPARDCVWGHHRPGELHVSPEGRGGTGPSRGSALGCPQGRAGSSAPRSTARHHGDPAANAVESLPREEQRWPRGLMNAEAADGAASSAVLAGQSGEPGAAAVLIQPNSCLPFHCCAGLQRHGCESMAV